MKYFYIFLSFLNTELVQVAEIFLVDDKDLFKHIEAGTKWLPFARHFECIFLNESV